MTKLKDILCVSGGFDPLHGGHLSMFQEVMTKSKLVVILNSDAWLIRKKGFYFLPWEQRANIIKALEGVEDVVAVDDSDDTVCEALKRLQPKYFVNGGDRKPNNTPEKSLCDALGIEMLWDIGGGKLNSSSDIAKRAWVTRAWGKYVTLDEGEGYKVKKLIVEPGKATSLQEHAHRSEFWSVVKSDASIMLDDKKHILRQGDPAILVQPGAAHQLANHSNHAVTIIELQTGQYLCEDDIERYA